MSNLDCSTPGSSVQYHSCDDQTYFYSCVYENKNILKEIHFKFQFFRLSFDSISITYISSVSSVAQACPTPCDPMNRSTPGLPAHHHLPEFTQTHVHQVSDAISHLILGRPLLLLTPIPPSIRVFSNESTLHMRWPKYSSFSFSIIPSKEIPGMISFRMDWLDLLAVQGTLKSPLQHHGSKHQFFGAQLSL